MNVTNPYAPATFGHIVRKNLRDEPTTDTAPSHLLIDGEHLQIRVEVTFLSRHLIP